MFDYLTNLLYRLDYHELCIGDASARCGDESDLIALVHDGNIPQRSYVDDQKNSGGPVFIDFLKRVQCCMLTGRFDTGNNIFTCISHRGRSVVDYMFYRDASITMSNVLMYSLSPTCVSR